MEVPLNSEWMKILEMETGLITKEVMLEQAAWEDKNELK